MPYLDAQRARFEDGALVCPCCGDACTQHDGYRGAGTGPALRRNLDSFVPSHSPAPAFGFDADTCCGARYALFVDNYKGNAVMHTAVFTGSDAEWHALFPNGPALAITDFDGTTGARLAETTTKEK